MLTQIKQEIKNDALYQQNFSNDGERFVAWYLRRVPLRDQIATRDDITDGQNDKQIDAVIADDEESRVVIIQGKFINESLIYMVGAFGFTVVRWFSAMPLVLEL